jgi:hypothetical protein
MGIVIRKIGLKKFLRVRLLEFLKDLLRSHPLVLIVENANEFILGDNIIDISQEF